MKNISYGIGFLLAILALFSAGMLIFQLRATNVLKKELIDRKKSLQEVRIASRKSKELKEKIAKSKRKEDEILKKIPKNKESVFVLIKELTFMGKSMGIKHISFDVKGFSGKGSEHNGKNAERSVIRTRRSPHESRNTKNINAGIVNSIHFTMIFSAGYIEVYKFIENILSMDRVVSLENVEIERDKSFFPRQRVSLKITTYSFSGLK